MADKHSTFDAGLLEAYVDAAEAVLNLNLAPEYRAGVVTELQRLLQMAELFAEPELREAAEAAASRA